MSILRLRRAANRPNNSYKVARKPLILASLLLSFFYHRFSLSTATSAREAALVSALQLFRRLSPVVPRTVSMMPGATFRKPLHSTSCDNVDVLLGTDKSFDGGDDADGICTDYDVIVIGGGLVGLSTAVALYRRGVKRIAVYERSPSLRPVGAAIGLYPNGLRALEYIDPPLAMRVRRECIPSRRFQRRSLQGELVRDTNVADIAGATMPNFYVWYRLQQQLAECLPPGVLHTSFSFEGYYVDEEGEGHSSTKVRVRVSSSHLSTNDLKRRVVTKTCRVLIGADGIKSSVRRQMFGEERKIHYNGKVMYRAVLPLDALDEGICPSAGVSVSYQGDEKGKSFSLRETAKGALVTVTAAAACDDEVELTKDCVDRKERMKLLFQDYPIEVQHVMDLIPPTAIHEDAVRDIDVEPMWSKGPVIIVGDAAHAMTPHMGQGANQGLEDVCELVHALVPQLPHRKDQKKDVNSSDDTVSIPEALTRCWQRRIDRVKEVHARSRQNTAESNRFVSVSAGTPFERRNYTQSFLQRLYDWTPPTD